MEKFNNFIATIKEPFSNIIKSMNNLNEGYSLKKEMAVVMLFIGVVSPIRAWMDWAIVHSDFSLLPTVLTITTGFIAVLIGINAIANNNNKDGNTNGNTTKTS